MSCRMGDLQNLVVLFSQSEILHPLIFVERLGHAPRDYNPSPTTKTWFWKLNINISQVRLHLPRRCFWLTLLRRDDVFVSIVGFLLLLNLGHVSGKVRPKSDFIAETHNHLSQGKCCGIRQWRKSRIGWSLRCYHLRNKRVQYCGWAQKTSSTDTYTLIFTRSSLQNFLLCCMSGFQYWKLGRQISKEKKRSSGLFSWFAR